MLNYVTKERTLVAFMSRGQSVRGRFSSFSRAEADSWRPQSKDDYEVGKVVIQCLVTQDANWYEQGIGKLILLYNKYPTRGGDYVEK